MNKYLTKVKTTNGKIFYYKIVNNKKIRISKLDFLKMNKKGGSGVDPCAICQEELSNLTNGQIISLPCHHRFHQNCLNDNCTIQPNTLVNCSCPTCRQIFNYNTELENLEQQVQNRIDELTAPPVVEQPVVEQPVVEQPVDEDDDTLQTELV